MSFGHLDPAQQETVRQAVQGRTVTDLGAGSLGLSMELLHLGAAQVIAVDKEHWASQDERVRVIRAYFNKFSDPIDVAFVSWPPNWHCPGLAEATERARIVIYLGKNSDGSACGTPELFHALATREVLAHVPVFKNTLIVYGPGRVQRKPLGEEQAALVPDVLYSFAELVYMDGHDSGHTSADTTGADPVGQAQLRGPARVDAPARDRGRGRRARGSPKR